MNGDSARVPVVQTLGPVREPTLERRRQLWRDATREIERNYADPLTVAGVARASA